MNPKVPAPAAVLLDFIAGPESGGNYLAYYAHGNSTKPLPETLNDVLLFQANLVHGGAKSSATGRYQFMPKTLQSLMKDYKLSGDEPFTNDLQDELGYYLLVRRGYDGWIAGTLSDALFADHLSMEWASLPYQTGRSYYDKDGLNKSLVSRASLLAVLAKAKGATTPVAPPNPTPAKQENTMEGLLGSLASIVMGVVTKGTTVASVAAAVPAIAEGAFKSIPDAQQGFKELTALATDIRGGKWTEVPEDITDILATFRALMIDFGIDHDGLNAATVKLATTPAVPAS